MAKSVKTNKDTLEKEINLDDIKQDLKDYIDIKIKNGFKSEIEDVNKRIVSEKNRRLFYKNILILILLIIIVYLVFLLYKENYFDRLLNNNNNNNQNIKTVINTGTEENNKTETKEKELTLEELIDKYSYLLDNINISEKSDYIKDYYSKNLSSELKKYLAFNNIDVNELSKEEDYNIFDSSVLKNTYLELFNDDYENNTFSYNGNKIRYINKLDSYVSDSLIEKSTSNIKREITKIVVDEDNINITTIEGLIKDNKLYNIVSSKEIKSYKKDKLSNYKDKLNTNTYTFNNEKLISIK